MSDNGGTSRDSSCVSTSFHNRVITVIIADSVNVCFMIAKLSSKYVKSGVSAFATLFCCGPCCVSDVDRPRWNMLETVDIDSPLERTLFSVRMDSARWMNAESYPTVN